ncbi:S-layer homology domain-containing protein [Caloranaerobacter ferrireducens]|uniref:S-layer homology domain-containing protein n=1 Tax=Caloranaerobacter ferrireducens TaxID=1323370 RepID=UPI00084DC5C0|nr:S-layer homology domain-containing protein [Caloranaerobacter ferrireducens]
MKKVLSLVLVLALVLGTFSFALAATPLSDVQGKDCEDAVARLVGLGIINGYEDGTYRPDRVLTRAELAKVVIIALGLEDVADFAESMTIFSDMDGHWAKKYVNVAASKGIIKGYPDGTFRPDATVSYAEAITLFTRALGYNDEVLSGTWPINYLTKAEELGITEGVKVVNAGANRGDIAILLDNTLQKEMVRIKDGEVESLGKSLISEIATPATIIVKDVKDDVIVDENGNEIDTLVDMSGYLFSKVKVYKNEDDAIVYVDEVLSETYEGTAAVSGNTLTVTDADDETKDFTLQNDTTVRFNDVDVDFQNVGNLQDAEVKVVYTTDADGNVDEVLGVIATENVTYQLVSEDYDAETVKDAGFKYEGITLPTTTNDDDETILDTDNIVVTGDVDELEDIKADDVIYVYTGKNNDGDVVKVKIVVVRDTVEGKVETAKADKDGNLTEVTVDGKDYEVAATIDMSTVTADSEVSLVLDKDGKVVAINAITEEAETVEGYVTEVETYNIIKDGTVTEVTDVTILTTDGEKTLRLASDATLPSGVTDVENDLPGYFGKATLNEDNEIAEFVDYQAGLATGTITVDEDNLDELQVGSTVYLVDSDVLVFDLVDEDYAKVEDLETDMNVEYELDSDNLYITKLFITSHPVTALDDVTGIYVGQYSKLTADGTEHYVTLNVEGEEIDYKVEATIDVSAITEELVVLSDSDANGEYDALANATIGNTYTDPTIDGSKLADTYLLTSSTVIYVVDGSDITIGTVDDITGTVKVVGSGTNVGSYEKADIIVVVK